ncbi:hypothetical protein C2S51_022232 [Perilla frutescens var. frutescens]|nr:hypothetical protein C2S51_022232 [Perilla frutescens var. frutescens]
MAERDVHEKAKNDEDLESNSSSDGILAALNIVLILSSLSSPGDPDEQRLNLEEIEERESGKWNQRAKNSGSRSDFPSRNQQVSGFTRTLQRHQTSKVQTKIRDCR